MKTLRSITMIALAAWALQSCGGKTASDSKAAADSLNTVNDTSRKDTSTQKTAMLVEKADADFATEAANGGLAEVQMGQLAKQKGKNEKVKNFGDMMMTDHTKANEELIAIAKTKNIALPAIPGKKEQKAMDDLAKKSPGDFDKAYVDDMIEDHKKDIKLFEEAAKNCKDPDIKAFAAKTLPVLQKHLDAINAIHDSMK